MKQLTLKEKRPVYTKVACDLMLLAEEGLWTSADIEIADRIQDLYPDLLWVNILKNREEMMPEYMLFRPVTTSKPNIHWWLPEEYNERIMALLFCVEMCK